MSTSFVIAFLKKRVPARYRFLLPNRNKKKGAARWQATARKVKIVAKKGNKATKRTVYKNSVSGELRVRKATVARDGTRKYVYVKF